MTLQRKSKNKSSTNPHIFTLLLLRGRTFGYLGIILQGMIFLIFLQEAEQAGFTSEDIQVAVNHCGDTNPVEWLRQGQSHQMINLCTSRTFVSVLPYVCKLILLNWWIDTIRLSVTTDIASKLIVTYLEAFDRL